MSVTNPAGEEKVIAGAFPSGCGKTNCAMMTPTLPGWKVKCIGDDIGKYRQVHIGGVSKTINSCDIWGIP